MTDSKKRATPGAERFTEESIDRVHKKSSDEDPQLPLFDSFSPNGVSEVVDGDREIANASMEIFGRGVSLSLTLSGTPRERSSS